MIAIRYISDIVIQVSVGKIHTYMEFSHFMNSWILPKPNWYMTCSKSTFTKWKFTQVMVILHKRCLWCISFIIGMTCSEGQSHLIRIYFIQDKFIIWYNFGHWRLLMFIWHGNCCRSEAIEYLLGIFLGDQPKHLKFVFIFTLNWMPSFLPVGPPTPKKL